MSQENSGNLVPIEDVFGNENLRKGIELDVRLTKEDIIVEYVSQVEQRLERERDRLTNERETVKSELTTIENNIKRTSSDVGRQVYADTVFRLNDVLSTLTDGTFEISDTVFGYNEEEEQCLFCDLQYSVGTGKRKHSERIDSLPPLSLPPFIISLIEDRENANARISDINKELMNVIHKLGNMDRIEREARAKTARKLLASISNNSSNNATSLLLESE